MTHQLIPEVHIGFTGTQIGMTESQKTKVAKILDITIKSNEGVIEWVHHGDCIGADEEFHELATERRMQISIHPPINAEKRANKEANFMWPEKPYLKRNSELVGCCDFLIAAPKVPEEEIRSGTWATIRMAKKCKKPIIIVTPDGKTVYI